MYAWLCILIMIACTYLVRVLPLTLIRKPIKNKFIRSFLYYVPYVTLAIMTVPSIYQGTTSPITGIVALVAGVVVALCGKGLFPVAITCGGVVLVMEYVLPLVLK